MGRACAQLLAPGSGHVVLTDVDHARLHDVAAAVERETGATVQPVIADLTEPDAAADLADRAAAHGSLRALVNTAGLSPTMAGWEQILRVDLVAVARLLDAFASHVAPGSVAVCLASIAGHMGEFDPEMDALLDDPLAPDLKERYLAMCGPAPDPGSTYRLAKRAVVRLCASAAVAWGARGGRVVSVSPGLIDTEMGRLELEHNPIKVWMAGITPVGAGRRSDVAVLPGRAGDVAAAVAFVCSDEASFVSGCDLRVDGGLLAAMEHDVRT
jgi:NAD(P)-dependent dehydrogenase (short-subunit alcohol dehydrogenase family)